MVLDPCRNKVFPNTTMSVIHILCVHACTHVCAGMCTPCVGVCVDMLEIEIYTCGARDYAGGLSHNA